MANFTPQEIEQFLQEFFDVVGARQYVGARYVPIFGRAGEETVEWDDGAPYEPLTVVMHEGVSYVSRRYVPSGIDIVDTAYWVETYRFNAQVEQYRREVLGFQDQIDQIRSDYVPFPDPASYPKYGTSGQVLNTLGDGTTRWVDPVVPSDAQAEAVITNWLDDHPEATTTVLDGAITTAKLANGAVSNLKLAKNRAWVIAGNIDVTNTSGNTYVVTVAAGTTISDDTGIYTISDQSFTFTSAYPQYISYNRSDNTIGTHERWYYGTDEEFLFVVYNHGIHCATLSEFLTLNGSYAHGTSWIADGAVTTDKLSAAGVTTAKLANSAVTTSKLAKSKGYVIQGSMDVTNASGNDYVVTVGTNVQVGDDTGLYPLTTGQTVSFTSAYPKYICVDRTTNEVVALERWVEGSNLVFLFIVYAHNVYGLEIGPNLTFNGSAATIDDTRMRYVYKYGLIIQGTIRVDTTALTVAYDGNPVVADLNGFYSVDTANSVSTFSNNPAFPLYVLFQVSTRTVSIVDRWSNRSADYLLLGIVYMNKVFGVNADTLLLGSPMKVTTYGDSITALNGWQPHIAAELNCIVVNQGVSSSCVSSFDTWATSMCDDTRLDAIPADSDVLVIMGGTNDWAGRITIGAVDSSDASTFCGGYNKIITSVMTRMPACRVIIMSMPFGWYNEGLGTGEVNGVGVGISQFVDATKAVADRWHLPFIDLYHELGVNGSNRDEFLTNEDVQVHPNAAGAARISSIVLSKIIELTR